MTFYTLYISYTHTHTYIHTQEKKAKFFRKYGYQLRILGFPHKSSFYNCEPGKPDSPIDFRGSNGRQKSAGNQPFPGEKRAAETANGRQKYRFPLARDFPKRWPKKYPRIHRSSAGSKTLGWAWNWRTAANGGASTIRAQLAPSSDYPGK